MERGNSYETTTRIFNATHQAENRLPKIGLRAIYNTIQRCRHIVASTESTTQSNESNLFHRQARFNWFCQLNVRFGNPIDTPDIEGVREFRERLKDEWVNEEVLKEKTLP